MVIQLSFGYQPWVNPIGYIRKGIVHLGEPTPVRQSGCDPLGYPTVDEITEPGFYRLMITGDMTVVFDGQEWCDDFEEVYEDGSVFTWKFGTGEIPVTIYP